MPELPEVETVREGLDRHIVGRRIESAQVLRDYSVRRHEGGPLDFVDRLTGQTVNYVARRGKFLWLGLDGVDETLVGHLGMSGQLLVKALDGSAEDHKHLRVRLVLGPMSEAAMGERPSAEAPLVPVTLDFVDQRTFGYLAVCETEPTPDGLAAGLGSHEARIPTVVAHIARDLLDPAVASGTPGRKALVRLIKSKPAAIKRVLLDQTVVSGIGNIYADESLWRAAVHGERPANKLTGPAIDRLLDHAFDVMSEALVQGGTSFDALYVNVNGESGYFDRSLNAYGREGEPCRRCGAIIRRSEFMNRSSYWCPTCQTRPRST
ncbi:bifunctional DNA-formamidopyrimidine glycosylase/DNA-(apurinic or apyrimidinic site) lyase [Timonella senegalensis]|uniref:bifunctional DNA-formamidopyrimidine glycosylase/DNA-(apurinic or apyrimidinic site) lyase n=1 Tax=Timonella senegalensis TaxID=1465825 RepID=UPI0002E31C4F|nr:bifunctional DNA-formamidopyrimidine glycosylase/DNA-(apurinic or apyrimidinic site) lyase [Timonella senegalensis]